MRVAIALTALCTLAGCFAEHGDPSDLQGRDLPLEEGTPPSASGEVEHTTTETKAADPGNGEAQADPIPRGPTTCGPDFKWCSSPRPRPVPGADCCWTAAKQCYEFAKDPSLCDGLRELCESLPVPPPPVPPAPSEYESCVIKASECYTWASDPVACDELRKRCETLLEPPPKPTPDAIAACYAGSATNPSHTPDTPSAHARIRCSRQ
jgi:hypothetical protein